jgi:hypothetical protein
VADWVLRDRVRPFGHYFWLSLAQLTDTGNPLISGKTPSILPSEEGRLFCVSSAVSSGSQTFCATKPNGCGFIEEKNAAWSD